MAWLNINEWLLDKAWREWRDLTINMSQEEAKKHSSYKEVKKYLNKREV